MNFSQTASIVNPDEKTSWIPQNTVFFFYVLLTAYLSIFILVINQLDAQKFVLQ